MSNNMRIWDAVSKTDPSHTKHVNQRGGFTAISAHYQIMSATKQFGPIGQGWGYDAGEPIFIENLVSVPVTIWHGSRDNRFGPIYGGAEWKNGSGRIDTDGIKKAETDALTKGLSQLGFNADVFLGRFDDNKYIEQVKEHFEQERQEEVKQQTAAELKRNGVWQAFEAALRACEDLEALEACRTANRDVVRGWPKTWQQLALDLFNEVRADIGNREFDQASGVAAQ